MCAALAPIDRDLLTSFRDGDEGALEQIFRSEFPALSAKAAEESDSPAAAPLIVERVFLSAWEQRSQFETPYALQVFLQDCVHRGAVREKSRRAALHRFEAHEGTNRHAHEGAGKVATMDEAWAQLAQVLHAPPPDPEAMAAARANASRHGAAAHVAEIAKPKAWGTTAAITVGVGLLLVLAIVYVVPRLNPTSMDARIADALASSETRLVATNFSQRGNVPLADETRAALGADTKLQIPPRFNQNLRAVGVEGSASFAVAPGGERPFMVRAGNTRVTATGTTIDVSAYPNDPLVIVRIRDGSGEVASGGSTRSLAAGEAVAIDRDGQMTTPGPDALEEAFAWTDGRFAVVNRPLDEVVPLLRRWYNLDLVLGDTVLNKRRATARAELGAQRTVIAELEKSANAKFGYMNERMILRDAAVVAAPARRR